MTSIPPPQKPDLVRLIDQSHEPRPEPPRHSGRVSKQKKSAPALRELGRYTGKADDKARLYHIGRS